MWFYRWKCLTLGSECNPLLGDLSCETNRNIEEDTFGSKKMRQQFVGKKNAPLGFVEEMMSTLQAARKVTYKNAEKMLYTDHVQSSFNKNEIHSSLWKLIFNMYTYSSKTLSY